MLCITQNETQNGVKVRCEMEDEFNCCRWTPFELFLLHPFELPFGLFCNMQQSNIFRPVASDI